MTRNEQIHHAVETIKENWENEYNDIMRITDHINLNISISEFLNDCTPCGGNWGGMLLTGIKHYSKELYDAIPDDMGVNAFGSICAVLALMGVYTPQE